MANVRDIARKADCSAATVSLVFQGNRRISEATATRVRAAARKLGYKYAPKLSLKSANSKQRRFLLVTSALTDNPAPVYSAVIDGIADASRELGIGFSLHQLKSPDCLTTLPAIGYDAIIYGMTDLVIEKILIERVKIPIVKVMSVPDIHWPYDHVTYNNSMIGRIAGNYFIKHGHRRVALAGHDNAMENERVNGVREIIEKNGGQAETLLWPANVSGQEINNLTSAFLAAFRKNKVTALFSTGDSYTVYIYQMLLHQGIRPGKDIEVVSCNNEDILEQLHPRPLSVDIHARSVGRMAVRQLLWRLENPKEPAVTLQMSPSLPGIN